MSESEDRTQPASQHRRQMAREQGLAVHSPELSAAAGWLVAVLVLGFWSEGLAGGLVGSIRQAMSDPLPVAASPDVFTARLRAEFLRVALPLAMIVGGFAAGSIAAHQFQVRGLWAPIHIAPDVSRLWNLSGEIGAGLGARVERNAWAVIKAGVLIGAGTWTIRAAWIEILRASQLDVPDLARSAGAIVLHQSTVLAIALGALGGIDYMLRYWRFEAMLRTTQQQQREDQRLVEGDLSLRSRRRQLAGARRADGAEILAGASLALMGDGGIVVILSGGPPPRKIHVRSALSGEPANRLRRAVDRAGLPQIASPILARRLALKEYATRAVPADLAAELSRIWPPMKARA